MSLRKRIMFWVWDDCPERTPYWLRDAIAWTACKIWGHVPIPDGCGQPDHEYCAWCKEPMPNAAPRKASTP